MWVRRMIAHPHLIVILGEVLPGPPGIPGHVGPLVVFFVRAPRVSEEIWRSNPAIRVEAKRTQADECALMELLPPSSLPRG